MTEQILGMLQDGASIVLQIAVLVGLFLLRGLKQRMDQFYEAKTLLQNRQLLAQLGQEAFSYAETVHQTEDGPAKMNEAVKYLLNKCDAHGMQDVPMKDMLAVIETAWLADRRVTRATVPSVRLMTDEER
ncbi:hypothetical protein CIG75_05680 [Tumebacillus algifaecis]|uniref:Phage holin n=1 Tax=Tumebacillus algifaecis TaxID=1214604 RepID=A0A223CZM1_9BACL|nr:phage holin, LLH family [Tumebacillus algifaecis]ASS74537.1 hypothetical protein CIG75_05680 [Tumebacillus algifaecis]